MLLLRIRTMSDQPFSCGTRASESIASERRSSCQSCEENAKIALLDLTGGQLIGKVLGGYSRYLEVQTRAPLHLGASVQIECGENCGLGEVIHISSRDGKDCCIVTVELEHGLKPAAVFAENRFSPERWTDQASRRCERPSGGRDQEQAARSALAAAT